MIKNTIFSIVFLLISSAISAQSYQNLALHRKAWHSSSADFVHTAHMATDGNTTQTRWESERTSWSHSDWIYVDLGKVQTIDKVIIHWDEAHGIEYRIQVSTEQSEPEDWKDVYSTIEGDGGKDVINFEPVEARFVRLLTERKNTMLGTSVWEFEVYGHGERVQMSPQPNSGLAEDGNLYLDGGWKLQNDAFVEQEGKVLASNSYQPEKWLNAVVPGTVLKTYTENGAVPDITYADNQLQISEFITQSKYWYRKEFTIPEDLKNKDKIWLNFEGINYLADVYLNGEFVRQIDRCFLRHRLDISDMVNKEGSNALAVKIYPVENPGDVTVQDLESVDLNGGKLGMDNPTFHFSVGWDWSPTVPGRNIGIWNDVYLRSTGNVSIKDPWVKTDLPLPDTSRADLTIETELINNSSRGVSGILRGSIGSAQVEKEVSLQGNEKKTIRFSPSDYSELKLENPRLWWPNGYGQPNLYTLNLEFLSNGDELSDSKSTQFGIRELSYRWPNGNNLQILVNGEEVMLRGGNWGSNDIHVAADKESYETKVKLHAAMNYNAIRNWVGQVGHEEFYDYCDKYGIMVWDDFWLANQADGPNPKDTTLFFTNAEDKVKNLRSHPSVAVWCGRNETTTQPYLDTVLSRITKEFDGTRLYVSDSRAYPANTSSGPWALQESPNWYFQEREGFLTELGMPTVPPIESMRKMMPEEDLWPISDMWGMHDFGGGNGHPETYRRAVNNRYGEAQGIEDFCRKAQLVNYNNYRALFESWGIKTGEGNSGGMIIWMSQSVWPSLMWQTYDYFYEPTAAFFGSQKGCEPVHIQWDASNQRVYAVNVTQKPMNNLKAESWIYNLDGKMVSHNISEVDVASYSNEFCHFIENSGHKALSKVHFVKMRLSRNGKVLSENFYWRSKKGQDYTALKDLPEVGLNGTASSKKEDGKVILTVKLENPTSKVAFFNRLKVQRAQSKENVLPIFYGDNYFSLLPDDKKEVKITFDQKDLNGENPRLVIQGWNARTQEIEID
jgi:hypothetical protein